MWKYIASNVVSDSAKSRESHNALRSVRLRVSEMKAFINENNPEKNMNLLLRPDFQ
jgi:hypothetical protein